MQVSLILGTKVRLTNKYVREEVKHLRRQGEVIGYSLIKNQMVFLVRLDKGFYSPEQDTFVSVIVCDESSLEVL
jgi:hypothetical protein